MSSSKRTYTKQFKEEAIVLWEVSEKSVSAIEQDWASEEHRQEFDITLMCRLLAVSRSGYYAWRHWQPSAREMADAQLLAEIKKIFIASGQTYGSPRIHIELRAEGIRCSRKRVARLMRENGLKVVQKRKNRVVTRQTIAIPFARQ